MPPFLFLTEEVSNVAYNIQIYDKNINAYANFNTMRREIFIDYYFDYYLFGDQRYNAYLEDTAFASFFFQTSTIIEFRNQPSQTWLIFTANVAGIFGLFIGITLTTFMELIWLMRICI